MEYTQVDETTATRVSEETATITLDEANEKVNFLTRQLNRKIIELATTKGELAEAQKLVEDLKALGLKTEAEIKEAEIVDLMEAEIQPVVK